MIYKLEIGNHSHSHDMYAVSLSQVAICLIDCVSNIKKVIPRVNERDARRRRGEIFLNYFGFCLRLYVDLNTLKPTPG